MTQSKLRQVLTIFENADGPLSLPGIARELDVSQARLEMMIQHWVRRGKIRESGGLSECGSCGHQDGCAFVMEMPRSYELVSDGAIPLPTIDVVCERKGE